MKKLNGSFAMGILLGWEIDSVESYFALIRCLLIFLYNLLDRGERGGSDEKQDKAIQESIAFYTKFYADWLIHYTAHYNTYSSCKCCQKVPPDLLCPPDVYEDCLKVCRDHRDKWAVHHELNFQFNLDCSDLVITLVITQSIVLNFGWYRLTLNISLVCLPQNTHKILKMKNFG